MKPTLYVVCGIPGSGKSYYCKNMKSNNPKENKYVSRDEIRYMLLEEGDSYFSHEDEVLEIFWNEINKGLAAGRNVYADQTSLSFKPRHWLLSHISVPCFKVAIVMDTPLDVCIERNNKRKGRERVPTAIIKNMYKSFTFPTEEEGFDKIIVNPI